LVPRQLPDVTDVVSSIVYARAADAALLPADTSYLVHVSGGPNVDPLDVSASAPGDPSDVHVAGEDTKGILVAAGAWVDLTWAADRADDVVYTDVQPASLRCVLGVGTADGKGLVHASLSASLFDDAGTLVVHRVRRESFRARNLESGVVRFDFSRSIAYARR
jgi:hypothetical protein